MIISRAPEASMSEPISRRETLLVWSGLFLLSLWLWALLLTARHDR